MKNHNTDVFTVLPPDTVYFITTTVIDWVDVFTREEYKNIIVESLDYCRKVKGLQIFAWVLMTNHIHLIASHSIDNEHLARTIGDFKKFTSKKVINAIINNPVESRKNWLLNHFDETKILNNNDASCSISKSDSLSSRPHYHLWQRSFDSYCIYNIKHLKQKIDYLHANPIRAGIVDRPEDYRYSSFRNYCQLNPLIEIDLLDVLL